MKKGVLKLLVSIRAGLFEVPGWGITGVLLIFCRPVNNPLTGVDRALGSRWLGQKEAERLRNKERTGGKSNGR